MGKYDSPKIDISPKRDNIIPKGLLWKIFIWELPHYYSRCQQDEQTPKRIQLEIWCLFVFLSHPALKTWMVNSKIWRDTDYRKKHLADFIVRFPELIIRVEERVQKLKCKICCNKDEPSIGKRRLMPDELPPLEPLGNSR